METTNQQKRMVYSEEQIARFLDINGWKKSVAGDYDFNLAVKGVVMALNNGKGLLLTGAAGVGKTHLLKTIRKGMKVSHWISCANREDLVYAVSPSAEIYLFSEPVFIDDFGCEKEIVVDFEKINAMSVFIQRHYDRGSIGRLYISTNLDASQINGAYDGRVFDRLMDECVVIKFSGKSKRERNIIK